MEKKKIWMIAVVAAGILLLSAGITYYSQGDHTGPALTLTENLSVGYGEKVGLYDVVRSISDESAYTVSITAGGEVAADGRSTVFPRSGTESVEITAVDEHGNKTVKTAEIQVTDTKPPVLLVGDVEIDLGAQPDYMRGISATDEIDGDLTGMVQVDTGKVNFDSPGVYPVIYRVSDRSGNEAVTRAALTIRSPEAKSISLNRQSLSLDGNGYYELQAQVEPAAWQGEIRWESSDSSIAVVNNGLVTWRGRGECTITATAGEVSARCEVECGYVTVSSLHLNHSSMELNYHESDQLRAYTVPSNWSGTVTWSSSDSDVATVNSSGGVAWAGEGTCTITASADGHSASCTVRCREPQVESLSIVEESISLDANGRYQIVPVLLPEGWPGQVTWSSSNSAVATVSDGLVTWVGAGTCTITASAGSRSDSVTVICEQPFLDGLLDGLLGGSDSTQQPTESQGGDTDGGGTADGSGGTDAGEGTDGGLELFPYG